MSELTLNADLSGIPEKGKIVVAFSGGADSMALTHYLSGKFDKKRIVCAHVNHMLRGNEANEDEEAAREFCRQNNLLFAILREDISVLSAERKIGTEECGRQVRYNFFSSLADGENDVIATAHNANDNAETMLMNMAVGSGLSGLSGIPVRRGKIIRPLLSVTRKEIEEYCTFYNLPFVTDSTNIMDIYTRNRIRNHVIPRLEQINPRFCEAANRLSRTAAEAEDFIRRSAEELLKRAQGEYGLSLEVITDAHPACLKQALKMWAENGGCGRLSAIHLEELSGSLKNGSRTVLPGGFKAECSEGYLTLGTIEKTKWQLPVINEITALPNGKKLKILKKNISDTQNSVKVNSLLFKSHFDCDTIVDVIIVRNRRDGDKVSPAGRRVNKSLKQLFMEMRVPAAFRDDIVILTSGDEIVFVEHVGVAEKFKVTAKTENAAFVEIL